MNYTFLSDTRLFRGSSESEIEAMLSCLSAVTRRYKKGEIIYHTGEIIENIGVVLSGGVNIEHDDYWGNTSLISYAAPGMIFGETYACLTGVPLMINVVADADTQILFLNVSKIMQTCSSTCTHHSTLIKNLLDISAHKNLQLSRRILHTSYKKIRDRLLSYFLEQQKINGTSHFTIHFNRQQLADYLNVDRSAMCNELSSMQKDGLLSYDKNTITLNNVNEV